MAEMCSSEVASNHRHKDSGARSASYCTNESKLIAEKARCTDGGT